MKAPDNQRLKLCFECVFNCTDWEGGSGGTGAGNLFFEANHCIVHRQGF